MNPYAWFKLLHILSVIVFLGNIFTGLFWMVQAHNTRNLVIINHTMKGIIRSDRFFTIPGVLVIVVGGFGAAIQNQMPLLHTAWIFWSIILFTISGIVFSWKLGPLQKKIYQLTSGDESAFDWNAYQRLFKSWDLWGLVALLTPVIALAMMVLKWPS